MSVHCSWAPAVQPAWGGNHSCQLLLWVVADLPEMFPPGREREGDAALLAFSVTFSSFLFWRCEAEGASEKPSDVLGRKPATSSQLDLCAGFTFCPIRKLEVIN